MTYGTHGTMGVGDVVSTTFSVWSRNFVQFFILYVVCTAPVVVLQTAFFYESGMAQFGAGMGPGQQMDLMQASGPMVTRLVILFVLGVVSYVLVGGALTHSVVNILDNRPVSIPAAIMVAVRRIVPLVLISIVSSILIGLGFVLLIIPGIIVALILTVTVPACVTERLGVIESLGRSAQLTKDFRGTIFLSLLVLIIILFILQFVLFFVVGLVIGAMQLGLIAQQLVGLVLSAVFSPIVPIATSVMYVKLVGIKEGRLTSDLAAAFD